MAQLADSERLIWQMMVKVEQLRKERNAALAEVARQKADSEIERTMIRNAIAALADKDAAIELLLAELEGKP